MREDQIIIGGQAVMEGVMMRAPHSYAVAVRRPDGLIVTKGERIPSPADQHPLYRLPIFRGAVVLIQSMVLGIKALNFSANVGYEATVESGNNLGAPSVLGRKSGPDSTASGGVSSAVAGLPRAAAFGTIFAALVFNVVLFILLPLLITNMLFVWMGSGSIHAQWAGARWYLEAWGWLKAALHPVRPTVAFNLVDGLIRMSFFLTMIWGMSLLKDIGRVFQYHGAEHKVVFTWEAGEDLIVENARLKPRQHPRCGTSFLMLVMLVAIVCFSVVRFDTIALNFAARILLIPLISGVSYEIIRASAKSKTQLALSVITRPGLWLQNITTREPDDSQLEVSISALKAALALEPAQIEGAAL